MTDHLATYTVTTSSGARFVIEMRLIESKKQYGRVDWLCVPVSGEGEVWLSEQSLDIDHTPHIQRHIDELAQERPIPGIERKGEGE